MSWKRLANNDLKVRLKKRARIIQLIREFFVKEGFLEVETPIVVPFAGQEPYLEPMRVEFTAPPLTPPRKGGETTKISSHFEGEVRRGYLITSPEYAHKKLLAAGFEKTFEITKAFRGGEHFGGLHNPEFTIIEWYRAHADYTAIMDDVERLVQHVAATFRSPHGGLKASATISYQGRTIDLSSPWDRISVAEAFKKYAEINLDEIRDDETFFKIFLTKIEKHLGVTKPTILYDYPAEMASLARLKPSPVLADILSRGERNTNPISSPLGRGDGEGQVAERFEVYIAGMELGNAFSELNDAIEQRRRFLEEQALRKKLGKEIIPLDEDFIDAVGNMPLSAGIAFGIDRLVMLLTNAKTIEEVLAFPAGELFI
ncbi:MAG: amino acid--tRNA ligase-related protein [bacterium]|nr:amino acid--tRNA ligase-related protein [bacterium]